MGALAVALVGLAAAGTSAYAGYSQNKSAEEANAQARADSQSDYEQKLQLAATAAKQLNDQYNDIVKERPNLSWSEFVRNRMQSIDDPYTREIYNNAKEQDFENLRKFAKAASSDNTANLLASADEISGGSFQEFVNQRNDLIRNTDAAGRYARAYELAAPVRQDASTVRYDNQGRLIEGQRADKLAFQVANEVQTQVEQEQKADLAQVEQQRLSAAQSQQEKASQFTQFYDPTGYATQLGQENYLLSNSYQQLDEQRAFDLYKMFAGAAAGITAQQPNYQSVTSGNELISQGIKGGTQALTDYYKTTQATKTPATTNTYG